MVCPITYRATITNESELTYARWRAYVVVSVGLGDERISTHRPWHDVRPSLRTRSRIVPQHRTDQREDGHLLVSQCHWTQGRLPAQGSSESDCPNTVPYNYFHTVTEPICVFVNIVTNVKRPFTQLMIIKRLIDRPCEHWSTARQFVHC